MSRIRIGAIVTLLLLVVGGGASALLWGLLQVPDFYQEALAEQPDPILRKESAQKFVQRTLDLVEEIKHAESWAEEFTQKQVNGWLAEELHRKYSELVPEGVTEPRVKFIADSILVGFHYSDEQYSGVISLRLRPWLVEPNQLAFEIQSFKAGLIPVPLEEILEEIAYQIEDDGWRVESREFNGNQVLVVHLEKDDEDWPVLEVVKVLEGTLQVAGSRGDLIRETSSPEISRLADQSLAE